MASALNVGATTPGSNTLTLEAEESININADIHATAALNVVLNADTNGDDKGGVNINADIRTGGGSLTTGANGATFFGGTNSGKNNRVIETSGGNVNIQNEARLQLNGGTLSINSAGGNVTFARNVASMNKYEAFMDHDFVNGRETAEAAAWESMIKLVYGNPYTNSNGQSALFVIDGQNDYEQLNRKQKIRASNMLAQIWELANLAATKDNQSDPDGKSLNGQHLVTITDKYENSAAMASARKISGSVIEYFTGGKETTTNPSASKVSEREFSWVTGPEKGQVFYITDGIGSGADQNGMYTNWVRKVPTGIPELPFYNEPNNNGGRTSQPYVAIGWTDQNGWDDVGNNATTIHGFIRETELPNSALSINSGAGNVTVGTKGVADTGRLGSGEGTGLRNLSIETTKGDVKVLGSIYVHDNNANAAADLANGNVHIATPGNVDVGQITADKKVEIATTGADKYVTVNGKIATDGLVSIEATDDITVHGIENGDTIRLLSTNPNGDGAITLAYNAEGGGALITKSTANDAVVIDLKGKNASFKNDTNPSKPAVKTGTNGGWKIYAYSPESGDFGTNLNSGTNAQWHATSSTYFAGEHAGNKYIFQVQPTITVKAADMTKVYGETMKSDDVKTTSSATFVGQDGKPYDVNAPKYANMFNEGELTQYYTLDTPFSSEGFEMKATRDGGINKTAVYEIEANQEGDGLSDLGRNSGYAPVEVEGGTVEILKRRIDVIGSGSQTYGDSTIRNWKLTAELTDKQAGLTGPAIVEGDRLDDSTGILAIKSDSDYAKIRDSKIGSQTADASNTPYTDAVDMTKVGFEGNAGVNYEIVTRQGNLAVDKAALHIHTGDIYTTYGTVKTATSTVDGLVNGDALADLAIGYGNYGGAYLDNNTRTNVPGQYAFHALYANPDFLKNYVVTNDDATVRIDMAQRKPDIDPHEPSNTSGTASYTSNLGGRQGVPGVDRVAGLTDAQLPFFRVEAGKVTQYGTYDVTETPSEVRLQPTGKRLPEPNQPKTQYREYTKTLTTADGSGQFLLTYDGSTFRIEPTDGAALALVHAGDAKHNVDLSAKALHVGFSEMGLVLESLDAVYICLDGHSQTGSDELA